MRIPALILLAALAAGCVHKIDIEQGNYVTQDRVDLLKPGMSRQQVRLVLGTPLLTDIFHADRWDYVYWHEDSHFRREQRKLAVFFVDGKLDRVQGDVAPKTPQAKAQ